jgi:hypothetical protein
MGNFYTSYTLRGPGQQAVAGAMAGRSAIVTAAQAGCVVVFDEESDDQNQEIIAELASRLSGQFRCPVLVALNHDDDFLWYQLYLSGELVDEYNSAPGYFGTDDEDAAMTGSEGGDAKTLCEAFGSNAVKEVEGILRRSPEDDDNYTFAIERHMELATALGIPEFGASGFKQIHADALPEGLTENDCVKTKNLVASAPLEDLWHRPVSGYYKVSFRAHPKLTTSIPIGWMPGTWSELECAEQELSGKFLKAAAAPREQFKELGFTEEGFKRLKLVLNPGHRDDGGINYLDGSRSVFGQLIYNRSYAPSLKREMERLIIAFTSVFANEILSCTNNMDPSAETLPRHKVVRIKSNDVTLLYQKFIEQLKQQTEQPRRFHELEALKAWFDLNKVEIFEDKVRRGLWVRMSDYEVAAARRKLPPRLPGT